MGRQARRRDAPGRVSRGLAVAVLAACVAGLPAGALWHPRPAGAADTIRGMSWHLDAMHIPDAHEISRGEGITVAVVDTGVDASHPDLRGQVLEGGEVGDDKSPEPTGDGRDDRDGHGTGMASLIAGSGAGGPNSVLGVAPDAKILPVRIAQTSDGSFQPADVYRGVRWAIDHGAQVVNMSLGGERSTDAPWKKQLIDYANSKDVVLIAAAGNTGQGDKRVAEPASIPGVVAVSGLTRDGTFWDGSARGPEVVVSAPAEELPMAAPRSVSHSGFVLADGTSGATALVSGVAALIRSAFPDVSANDVVNRLIHTAEDRGTAGRDDQYGYGVVDARAALEGDVPGVERNPLVSPEPVKSDDTAAAGVAAGGTGNAAVILVGGSVATVLVLLLVVYLVSLARRSRQVVLAGVAPGVGPMQVPSGMWWAPAGSPGGHQVPGSPGAQHALGYPGGPQWHPGGAPGRPGPAHLSPTHLSPTHLSPPQHPPAHHSPAHHSPPHQPVPHQPVQHQPAPHGQPGPAHPAPSGTAWYASPGGAGWPSDLPTSVTTARPPHNGPSPAGASSPEHAAGTGGAVTQQLPMVAPPAPRTPGPQRPPDR